MLEGSLDLSHGQQVKVDMTNIQQFALFPGQVSNIRLSVSLSHNILNNTLWEGIPFFTLLQGWATEISTE
jgi:hypothetical protein